MDTQEYHGGPYNPPEIFVPHYTLRDANGKWEMEILN